MSSSDTTTVNGEGLQAPVGVEQLARQQPDDLPWTSRGGRACGASTPATASAISPEVGRAIKRHLQQGGRSGPGRAGVRPVVLGNRVVGVGPEAGKGASNCRIITESPSVKALSGC